MEFHEVANIFPMMTPAEMQELRQDMRENGYRVTMPILLSDGKIIDGRNRYTAALAEGIEPVYADYPGGDPLKFVISTNLHRRHLNETQRGIVASKLETMKQGDNRFTINRDANWHVYRAEAASMLNISPRTVARIKAIEKTAPELLPKMEAGEMTAHEANRIIMRVDRIEKLEKINDANRPLNAGLGKFNIILADPPWQYEHTISDSRMIENQYPTMGIDEIIALPVQTISEDDAVIFLWATTPMLKKGIQVLDAWGFEYRTAMVWIKPSIGPGWWVRNRHEHLLIGTRGNVPTPKAENKPDSVIEAPREEHSKKPEIIYSIIENMYPTLSKIELFSRQKRDGWSAWGNQA